MKPEDVPLRQVLFEFEKRGKAVRVTAVDPDSNTEVVMVGDPKAGDALLKRLAIRKLRYVIAKKMSGS